MRPGWITCSSCGQRAEGNKALGINGCWLCERCMADKDKLDTFLEARFRPIGKVIAAIKRGKVGGCHG